jgi:hypothetical protein
MKDGCVTAPAMMGEMPMPRHIGKRLGGAMKIKIRKVEDLKATRPCCLLCWGGS